MCCVTGRTEGRIESLILCLTRISRICTNSCDSFLSDIRVKAFGLQLYRAWVRSWFSLVPLRLSAPAAPPSHRGSKAAAKRPGDALPPLPFIADAVFVQSASRDQPIVPPAALVNHFVLRYAP